MISDKDRAEANDRGAFYKRLMEAVEASDMGLAEKWDIKRALGILSKPHTGSRTPEEWVRRLTMIEKGKRIRVSYMRECPFCGCEMELEEILMCDLKTIRYDPVLVTKHKRGCQLEFSGSSFIGQPETIKGAVEKWNRRKEGGIK